MSHTQHTPHGIAFDRGGPRDALPVVLLHAGVADRRMWDPVLPALIQERDVVRLDLRGFGDSGGRPKGALAPVDDVVDTLSVQGISRCHLVGASFGAGVAAEVALLRPELVSAPGGSLIAELTPDLRTFFEAERSALDEHDLDRAVKANLACWVDGPYRDAADVAPEVRELVGAMQRRAFELTAGWEDIDQRELDPPALERLSDVRARTLVLNGALDVDAILDAARRVVEGVPFVQHVVWSDAAHLPSMERLDDFVDLLLGWLRGAADDYR